MRLRLRFARADLVLWGQGFNSAVTRLNRQQVKGPERPLSAFSFRQNWHTRQETRFIVVVRVSGPHVLIVSNARGTWATVSSMTTECKCDTQLACTVSFSFNRLLCGSVQMKPASTSFVYNQTPSHVVLMS